MKRNARVEQFRQARQIHGGTVKMAAAAVGVKLARLPIPSKRLRERLFRTIYGRKYAQLREEQLEQPLAEFRSLNELFTRGIRSDLRPIEKGNEHLVCPCDGVVQDSGDLTDDTMLTAKEISYPLADLLPHVSLETLRGGTYAIYFLSPADCHRVFCPHEAELTCITHVPGRRFLVHPLYQRKQFPVYSLNERLIMELQTPIGSCVLVMVAGWGVGNITHPFVIPLKKNKRRITSHTLEEPRRFQQGEWLATFELGSTVILITGPDHHLRPVVKEGASVQYGQVAFANTSIWRANHY